MKVRGGQNIKRILKEAGKGGVYGVDGGFFETAKYPDGTPVANVAARHEYGLGVPERPFMKRATPGAIREVRKILKARTDGKKMIVDEQTARLCGEAVAAGIRQSITELDSPPNSPATIAAKGSSNPLVDTSRMRRAVTYKVIRNRLIK